MKNNYMSKCWFLLLFGVISTVLSAQAPSTYGAEAAYQDILKLKSGVLVVRLEGDQKKLAALEQIRDNRAPEARAAIQSQIDEVIIERDSFNLSLIRAFDENFRFCPVYFIYDHDARDFLGGKRSGIFLNGSGEVDASIAWPEQDFLGLRIGAAVNGPEGLIMTDPSFRDLPDPFPGFIQRNSIGSFVNWVLAREIYYRKNAQRMTSKLDKQLTKWYSRALLSGLKADN